MDGVVLRVPATGDLPVMYRFVRVYHPGGARHRHPVKQTMSNRQCGRKTRSESILAPSAHKQIPANSTTLTRKHEDTAIPTALGRYHSDTNRSVSRRWVCRPGPEVGPPSTVDARPPYTGHPPILPASPASRPPATRLPRQPSPHARVTLADPLGGCGGEPLGPGLLR